MSQQCGDMLLTVVHFVKLMRVNAPTDPVGAVALRYDGVQFFLSLFFLHDHARGGTYLRLSEAEMTIRVQPFGYGVGTRNTAAHKDYILSARWITGTGLDYTTPHPTT